MARLIRVLEYEGDEEWLEQCKRKRGIQNELVIWVRPGDPTESRVIRELACQLIPDPLEKPSGTPES